jgi:hypothetical protein
LIRPGCDDNTVSSHPGQNDDHRGGEVGLVIAPIGADRPEVLAVRSLTVR